VDKTKARAGSAAKLYCFANPAGRAIYITIDDGWAPSAQVLALGTTRSPIPI
jgi:peptidoglycan/xylan/chitin deacetylase (PgdA/CDA1 family)